MTPEAAETIALNALAYLANQPDALERFLTLSGTGVAELRERVGEAGFLAGVVDFLLTDEELLVDFCEAGSLDAKSLHLASHTLGSV
jgi:hypothetical protein